MSENLEIIHSIFEHRLHQADLDRILSSLSRADRNELLGKIGDLLQRISALIEVSNKISDTLMLDVLLPRLMEIVSESLQAERSSLFLYDEESDELFSMIAQGDSIGEIRFPSHLGIAGSVFTDGQSVIIDEAYKDARFNPEVDRKTGFKTRNILCAPIRNKKRQIIGVTQVLNKARGNFNNEDLALLEAITSQAASALENAQLFEKIERARHEESRLLELTSAISSELQLDSLLNKIVHTATEMLDADRSTLFMYDRRTDELWSKVAEGVKVREIRFPADAGIAGTCLTSGTALNIPNAYGDPRFNPAVDRKTGYKTRNILCMPIINKKGQKLGVMQVLNKKGGPFGPVDEKRLQAFSAQASIALENAQLFEEVLNARNYNESILKSLSNGVITMDTDGKVIKINSAAERIFQVSEASVAEKDVLDLFAEGNDWIAESIAKVAKSGEVDLTMDTDIHISHDAKVSVNLAVVPLIDIKEEPIGFMLVFEDISREKRIKTTMARYMPKEVMDKLIEEGESMLGGASQEVTVLFSDIRSFTTISEQLGARETVSMLNEYFSDMIEVIFDHGGILDKYIGDAIMALFGTPFRTEEDTDNAVTVSNKMIISLNALNERRKAAGREPIEIGIGVSTGEVVAGNIGSPKRMDYTVIGDSVNLAARLEGANKYYGTKILMSEFTVKQLKGQNRLREIDFIRVKGKREPIAIFEALDYHNEKTFPHMDKAIEEFHTGLKNYRKRDWEWALVHFGKVLELNPKDRPAALYMDRCRKYMESSPDSSWDGVWTMTRKK